MPLEPKLVISDLYEQLPALETKAGDIWQGLPTLGLLHQSSAKGIVITPACDLANRKSETVTYLPLVPVCVWLASRANRGEQMRLMRGQMQVTGLTIPEWLDPAARALGSQEDCEMLTQDLSTLGVAASQKKIDAAQRVLAGLEIVRAQHTGELNGNVCHLLERLYGEKALLMTLDSLVRNSHKPDVHLLPTDGQSMPLSAMPECNLALFRYPLTLPIEIFDSASDISKPDWINEIKSIAPQFPAAILASPERPMKLSRLKPRYFADLLARFIALHVRMGTPDYTDATVSSLVDSIRNPI